MKFFLWLFRFVLVNHKPELDTEYLSKETKEQLEHGQKREVIFFCRESKTAQAWKLLSILKSNSLFFITLSVLIDFLFQVNRKVLMTEKAKKKWRSKVETNSDLWPISSPRISCVPPSSRRENAALEKGVNFLTTSKSSCRTSLRILVPSVSCSRLTGSVRMDWHVDTEVNTYRRIIKILSTKSYMKRSQRLAS